MTDSLGVENKAREVSDAMVQAACIAVYQYDGDAVTADAMRAALRAALDVPPHQETEALTYEQKWKPDVHAGARSGVEQEQG